MKTLNIVLVVVMSLIVAFITSMIIIFCVKGSVPDTLITCVLGTGTAELIVTALITIFKNKYSAKGEGDENSR